MIVMTDKFNKLPKFRLNKQSLITAARITTVCLLLLFVWTLGRLAWMWVDSDINIAVSSNLSNVTPKEKTPNYQINQLINDNLFGTYQEKNTVSQPVATHAPKTALRLTLVGVVASTNPKYALAVIGNSGLQQVYTIGETIKNTRAILRQVMSDRVVLANNGRDEVLMLDGVQFEVLTSPKNSKEQKPTKATSKPSIATTSSNASLSGIKAEILKNPQSLLKYITLSQQRDDKGVVGYRIGPGRDSRLFNQAGLQANDLVVSINGSDLRNPSEMAKVWQKLTDASEINLTVLRDGQEHNVLIGL